MTGGALEPPIGTLRRLRRSVRRVLGRGGRRAARSESGQKVPRWSGVEPPACPPGWQVGPPSFVGLGAQKAGTTWWFRAIEAHPDVHQDPQRTPELHFFDRFQDTWPTTEDLRRYERFFPRPPGGLAGEKTPEYLSCFWVPAMLHEAAPRTRLIVLLRDPIERFISGRTHEVDRSGTAETSGRTFIDEEPWLLEAFERGRYAEQLERVLRWFDREQLLCLQYEACVADPQRELARTYDFLGLSPYEPPTDQLVRPRNRTHIEKVDLHPRMRETLVELYRTDVERLRAIVPDLDLALWPDFARP